ncbi:hypothetical protein ANCDUO_09727 [Ancylostoma duodenale]|uniref:Uncharacterized protein n=1 Tax=Ancylostoma duodenale TaxID=51022 RepID=A0A0C2GM31_9BILA|nr:hypothetical protein ANCDUO_09727 [Ancylostoma duodenale]
MAHHRWSHSRSKMNFAPYTRPCTPSTSPALLQCGGGSK